jgi:excisionase family DNA binding protein
MTSPRLPIEAPASPGRRGGVRGTGAASGSPPVDEPSRGYLSDDPLLIDSREVAHLLGIGRTTAFTMMARDELPVVRIGRCVRVSRDALVQWVVDRATR